MAMTFKQWVNEYKRASGLKSVAGNTAMLRQDYDAGYTPQQASEYNRRGYGPHFAGMAAMSEKWMRIVED